MPFLPCNQEHQITEAKSTKGKAPTIRYTQPVKTEWWDVDVVVCDEVQTCI